MEGGASEPRSTTPKRSAARSTTPEQRAALRKQKEERQKRARRRAQGLPEDDQPASPRAQADPLEAILKKAEADKARAVAAAAEQEAAAAAAAAAEKEKEKAEEEEARAAAAKAAEEKAAAEAAAATLRAEQDAAAAAAAKAKADGEAAEQAAAAGAERERAAAAAAAAAEAQRDREAAETQASAAQPAASAAASSALVILEVTGKHAAGFTCDEDLTVVKLPPGKKGSQAEAAGVTIGMRCVAFQGNNLDDSVTWTTLKGMVKEAAKPWTFAFSAAAGGPQLPEGWERKESEKYPGRFFYANAATQVREFRSLLAHSFCNFCDRLDSYFGKIDARRRRGSGRLHQLQLLRRLRPPVLMAPLVAVKPRQWKLSRSRNRQQQERATVRTMRRRRQR